MKIVIDQNIRGAEATFGDHGDLVKMNGRDITREHLADADLLIIRTATRADEALLAGSAVRFVGTTSIGTDHLDIDWLERQGITWANAPGCNADSAAQYTLSMMWLACQRLEKNLLEQTVGIIGRGNVGSRLQALLHSLGVETVANDPPLADRGAEGLFSQAEALDCDIVSLHVPLTFDGPYPTHRMLGTDQLQAMHAGSLLVNAARGDVVDGEALLRAVCNGQVHAALDVWPGEPRLSPELLNLAVVATPHVAGYSHDGRHNGTAMVYAAYCDWADLPPRPHAAGTARRLSMTIKDPTHALNEVLEAACFVARHDRALRLLSGSAPAAIASGFDNLRKAYPFRRDFQGWDIHCADDSAAATLKSLGFSVTT